MTREVDEIQREVAELKIKREAEKLADELLIDIIKKEETKVVELLNTVIHILKDHEKVDIRRLISSFDELNKMGETRHHMLSRLGYLRDMIKGLNDKMGIINPYI